MLVIYNFESRTEDEVRDGEKKNKERIMNEAEACLVKNVIYDLVKTL